jgi:hypothetical protein
MRSMSALLLVLVACGSKTPPPVTAPSEEADGGETVADAGAADAALAPLSIDEASNSAIGGMYGTTKVFFSTVTLVGRGGTWELQLSESTIPGRGAQMFLDLGQMMAKVGEPFDAEISAIQVALNPSSAENVSGYCKGSALVRFESFPKIPEKLPKKTVELKGGAVKVVARAVCKDTPFKVDGTYYVSGTSPLGKVILQK